MAKRVLTEVEIDRAKWLTGEALSEGAVLDSGLRDRQTGMQCCLGFVCRAVGFSQKAITDQGMPYELDSTVRGKSRLIKAGLATDMSDDPWGDDPLAHVATVAANINDNDGLTRRERESKVKAQLKELGFKAKFVGKYPDYKVIAAKFGRGEEAI